MGIELHLDHNIGVRSVLETGFLDVKPTAFRQLFRIDLKGFSESGLPDIAGTD